MEKNIPQGVVAILVGSDGREIVSVTDFHCGSPGGFTQKEAQEVRSSGALAMKAMRELASPVLSDAITQYDAEKILRKMCNNGCRVIFVPVGYDG